MRRLALVLSTLALLTITIEARSTPQNIRVDVATNDCPGSDPFETMGGGVCFHGDWYPPDYPIPGYPTTVTVSVSWADGSTTATAPVYGTHATLFVQLPNDLASATLDPVQAGSRCAPSQLFTVSTTTPLVVPTHDCQ